MTTRSAVKTTKKTTKKPGLKKTSAKKAGAKKTVSKKSVAKKGAAKPKPLELYKKKRDFTKTAEPAPKPTKVRKRGAPRFVIQKHEASHLHYDFRLEMNGVLVSWAVPKGPPYALGEKRLAMAVEDHPMEYRDFEGIIPKGQYGGGTVMVWDRGTYEVVEGKLEDGKLHLLMNGDKLKGEWALQKWRGVEDNRWLLFKAKESTKPLSKKRDDESVKSGRTMKQIAKDADAVWD